jgi:cobalt/nickel transport protein
MKRTKRLWWAILLLVVLSPLGLILPHIFQSGPAWGEWGLEEIGQTIGFVPEGLKRIAEIWSAPVPDYNLRGWEGKGLARMSVGYILSGALGVGAIVLISFFLGKFLRKKE